MAKGKSSAKTKRIKSGIESAIVDRLESDDFVKSLADALSDTLKHLANTPLGDVLDRKRMRKLIAGVDFSLFNEQAVLTAATDVVMAIEKLWQRNKLSANKLMDKKLRQKVEDVLAVEIELSDNARTLVDRIMKSNFVASLYTDVLHVTIVGFYKKINPLFGGLTTKVLESQIKGFIQLFIKIVLDRATEFVVKKENIALFSEFTREVIRLLLNEPIHHFFAETSPEHRDRLVLAVREVLRNKALEKTIGDLVAESFDAVYDALQELCLDDILDVPSVAASYALPMAEILRDQLRQAPFVAFLNAEYAALRSADHSPEAK